MSTMRSGLTVGNRFALTAGVQGILSLLVVAGSILGFGAVNDDVHALATQSVPGSLQALSIKASVYALRGDFLRAVAETNASQIPERERSVRDDSAQLSAALNAYAQTIANDTDRADFEKLKPEVAAIESGWVQAAAFSREMHNAEANAVYTTEISPHMVTLRAQLDTMVQGKMKASETTLADTANTARNARVWMFALGVSLVVLGVGVSWWMIASLRTELTRAVMELASGTGEIASAAAQVAASSGSLAQGAAQQASSIEEIAASGDEIKSMSQSNGQAAQGMATKSRESLAGFATINTQLEDMVVSMHQIGESSGKIARIIKVIDGIAFQTNILALNAAVEAARAGDAGMGFAVVADEVRQLAQRCAQAAQDTSKLIEESVARSYEGREKVDEVVSSIRMRAGDSERMKSMADAVNQGSEEQSRGLVQIATALSGIESVTQATAAGAEECAGQAAAVNTHADRLSEIVEQLRGLAGVQESPGLASGRPRKLGKPVFAAVRTA